MMKHPLVGLLLLLLAPASRAETPVLRFSLKPESMEKTDFAISGTLFLPDPEKTAPQLFLLPQHAYQFRHDGKPVQPDSEGRLPLPTTDDLTISFEGVSRIPRSSKCQASHDEIYVLNNVAPNPEVFSSGNLYQVDFDLPAEVQALTSARELPLENGLAFQIARFQKPVSHKVGPITVTYVFPTGFEPDPAYQTFLEKSVAFWTRYFGPLPFEEILVGAIRRDEELGTLSGSPNGNLILFSRTVFRDPPKFDGLEAILGTGEHLTRAFRKNVLSHEVAHFWFGSGAYKGKDGWMVEGIPQYLACYAIRQESDPAEVAALLKYAAFHDGTIPADSIADQPYGDGALYTKAYWSGSLALYRIGEKIGHERLIGILGQVFAANRDPSFADVTRAFLASHPGEEAFWKKTWRVTP